MNNQKVGGGRKEEEQKDQGFIKVPSQIKGARMQENQEIHKNPTVSKKFEIQEDITEDLTENNEGKKNRGGTIKQNTPADVGIGYSYGRGTDSRKAD